METTCRVLCSVGPSNRERRFHRGNRHFSFDATPRPSRPSRRGVRLHRKQGLVCDHSRHGILVGGPWCRPAGPVRCLLRRHRGVRERGGALCCFLLLLLRASRSAHPSELHCSNVGPFGVLGSAGSRMSFRGCSTRHQQWRSVQVKGVLLWASLGTRSRVSSCGRSAPNSVERFKRRCRSRYE